MKEERSRRAIDSKYLLYIVSRVVTMRREIDPEPETRMI